MIKRSMKTVVMLLGLVIINNVMLYIFCKVTLKNLSLSFKNNSTMLPFIKLKKDKMLRIAGIGAEILFCCL